MQFRRLLKGVASYYQFVQLYSHCVAMYVAI